MIPLRYCPSPSKQDHVQMWVELEIVRGALNDGDRACLRPIVASTLDIEPAHGLDEDPR